MRITWKKSHAMQTALMIFAFLAFFIPQPYAVPAIIYKLWKYARFFVSVGAVGLYLLRFHNRWPFRVIIVSVFYVWLFVAEPLITEHGQFLKMSLIVNIGFIFLLEYCFKRMDTKAVTRAFLFAGMLASLMHFITFILYANVEGGMRHGQLMQVGGVIVSNTNQNWYFLTYDNYSIVYFLPVAALLLIYAHNYMKSNYAVYWCYVGFILFMYFYKTAATAMVAMSLFVLIVLYYMMRYSEKKSKKLKLKINYFTAVLSGVIITIIAISVIGGGLAATIGEYFGKDGSFSGRDKIWANSLKLIADSPLIGYGRESESVVWMKLGQTHCHNIVLELLYEGGIIGFVLFGIMIYLFRPKQKDTFSALILSAAVLCYLIVATFDWGIANPISISVFYFSHYLTAKQSKLRAESVQDILNYILRKRTC